MLYWLLNILVSGKIEKGGREKSETIWNSRIAEKMIRISECNFVRIHNLRNKVRYRVLCMFQVKFNAGKGPGDNVEKLKITAIFIYLL